MQTFADNPTDKPILRASQSSNQRVKTAASAYRVPVIVSFAFCLVVFTIPLESVAVAFGDPDSPFSLPQLAGLLFGMSVVFHFRRVMSKPPAAFFWWLLYPFLLLFSLRYGLPDDYTYTVRRVFMSGQLLVFFLMAYSVMKDRALIRSSLYVYVVSCLILALGVSLDLPLFMPSDRFANIGRQTFGGSNPNSFATLLAVAVLILMALVIEKYASFRRIRYDCVVAIVVLVATVVDTGSRGGALTLLAGMFVFVLTAKLRVGKYVKWAVALLMMTLLVYLSLRVEGIQERWERTLESGNLAKRELIYPAAIEMFTQEPLFGWGPYENIHQLGVLYFFQDYMDTHNSILHIATEFGLMGAIPFMIGLFLVGMMAWRSRSGPLGNLPLALFVCVLMANMSGTALFQKVTWYIFALAAAAGTHHRLRGDDHPVALNRHGPLAESTVREGVS